MSRVSKIGIGVFAVAGSLAVFAVGCAKTAPPAKTSATEINVAEASAVVPCPDGDQDGSCDADDRCPMKSGPKAAFGCPIDPCGGAPLLVLVQFKYDSSDMPARKGGVQTMDPVLDAVAAAIAQDPSCNVCILGHASEEGTVEYNEDLSNRRASAVQDYMTNHNLAQIRVPTTGMGERCQLVPERSRPLNRRVEFRRLQEGQSCPSDCS